MTGSERDRLISSAKLLSRFRRRYLPEALWNYISKIAAINTREALADFVEAMSADLEVNGDEWENPTLERFLDAMARWIRVMDGYYKNTGQPPEDVPSWRTLANILYAAKIYE